MHLIHLLMKTLGNAGPVWLLAELAERYLEFIVKIPVRIRYEGAEESEGPLSHSY